MIHSLQRGDEEYFNDVEWGGIDKLIGGSYHAHSLARKEGQELCFSIINDLYDTYKRHIHIAQFMNQTYIRVRRREQRDQDIEENDRSYDIPEVVQGLTNGTEKQNTKLTSLFQHFHATHLPENLAKSGDLM